MDDLGENPLFFGNMHHTRLTTHQGHTPGGFSLPCWVVDLLTWFRTKGIAQRPTRKVQLLPRWTDVSPGWMDGRGQFLAPQNWSDFFPPEILDIDTNQDEAFNMYLRLQNVASFWMVSSHLVKSGVYFMCMFSSLQVYDSYYWGRGLPSHLK